MMWNESQNVNEQARALRDFELLENDIRNKIEIEFDLTNEVSRVGKFIAKTFDFRLHYFKTSTSNSRVIFKGCITECGSCAFVELNSEHELWTVGHELWHLLELNSAFLIETIVRKLRSQLSKEIIDKKKYLMDPRHFREKIAAPNPNPPTEQQVYSELIADLNACIFTRPIFWSKISDQELDIVQKKEFNQMSEWLNDNVQPEHRCPLNVTEELLEDFVSIWSSRLKAL